MQCKHKSLLIFLREALTQNLFGHFYFQFSNTLFYKAKYPIPGGILPCEYHIANITAPVPVSENSTLSIDGDGTCRALTEVSEWEIRS